MCDDFFAKLDALIKSDPLSRQSSEKWRLVAQIGQDIKALRENAGFTQTEMAALADLTEQELYNIEHGRAFSPPSIEVLLKIAIACGAELNISFTQQNKSDNN